MYPPCVKFDQAVVADASSFFGERSAAQGPSVAAAPADTAIVEGFDLHVKVKNEYVYFKV